MTQISALLIDDSETDRYIARRVLSRSDAIRNVEERSDGSKVLELFKKPAEFEKLCGPRPPPTLVFIDINMPGMSGFELLESMQELGNSGTLDASSSCIVIMLTSSSFSGDREKALNFDFVADYVEKPLNRDKLQTIVERHYPDLTPDRESC